MTLAADDYTTHYRWEWLRRGAWQPSFRRWKRHSSGAFVELIREHGMEHQPVLDCSCGLGLKTIILREAGLKVQGSDRCAQAIQYAQELAHEEHHADLPYFVSAWDELPQRTCTRFAGIFNDALSSIYDESEMIASLRGLRDCLRPGGLLAYMGALPGTDVDPGELLEQEWLSKTASGRHHLGFHFSDGTTAADEVVCFERGADYIDEHHVITITDGRERRLESWVMRSTCKWSWPRMEPLLRHAGFSSFQAKPFIAANGRPFQLVVAQRD